MGGPGSVIGRKLDRGQRKELLQQFAPLHVDPVAIKVEPARFP